MRCSGTIRRYGRSSRPRPTPLSIRPVPTLAFAAASTLLLILLLLLDPKICRYFITLSMWDLSGSTTFAQARLCYLKSITKLDRWNGFKSFAGYAWHVLREHATGTRAGKSISYGTNFITSFNKVPSVASSWLGWRYIGELSIPGGWVGQKFLWLCRQVTLKYPVNYSGISVVSRVRVQLVNTEGRRRQFDVNLNCDPPAPGLLPQCRCCLSRARCCSYFVSHMLQLASAQILLAAADDM